jgi:PAS domain S-box-containing protein
MLNILLVDDNETGRYAMGRMLRHAGFAVTETDTGHEALRLAAEQPDLIILDVKLPDLSGFEVCQRLKSDPTTAVIPVLQISAIHIQDEDRALGLTMGADSYLTGPVDPSVLLATIQAVLRVRQVERRLREANQALEVQRQALEQSNRALRESEERLRLALYAAGMGAWELNAETDEERWSPETEALWGLEPGTFAGTAAAFLATVHAEDRDRVQHARTKILTTREGRERLEYRIVWPDGTVRWMLVVGQSSPAAPGQSAGARGVGLDITEQKNLEQALGERAGELERLNTELQQFGYIVSHDLQEPLRTITNFVQLLARHLEGSLDAQAQELMGFVVGGAQRMQALITDLLAYARVSGPLPPFQAVDGEALLARVLGDLQLVIADAGAEVTHDPLPVVHGDAGQLGLVVQNLVGNALKFRGAAAPRIHVGARREGGQWVFSVRDNGIGIEARYRERIFQVFQRLHSRGEYAGTGIGLAICQKIIERHGGRIWVESEPGHGATFFFTLPTPGAPVVDGRTSLVN